MPDEPGKEVFMKLNKFETEVLVAIDKSYKEFVRADRTCVVKLRKALYGCVESARLWYEKLTLGFKVNQCDQCIFNRMEEDGKQTTLCLHVDDMLIMASDDKVISDLILHLEEIYGKLSVERGAVINYLGMTFDWRAEGKCKITMDGYVEELLTEYNEIEGVSTSPATNDLFKISEKSDILEEHEREYYHTLTAKLLYLGKRVRPDILTAISFLAKRVQQPTEEDLKKLYRVIRYLRGAKNLGIILESDINLCAIAYIDASYGVHEDYKSHSGCVIGIGRGPTYVKSSGQRLNTKSSTEAELVALSDNIGQVLWTRNFLIEQGHQVGPATVYQDNQSTMTLVKNGKSNSEKTKHIAVRFYFVKDRVTSGEIKIEYMKTGEMIADILTKPLQGQRFIEMRKKLLNWDE